MTRNPTNSKETRMNALHPAPAPAPDLHADPGFDLQITPVSRQAAGAGTWVCGTLHGHRFQALAFPEHAQDAGYELGDSRLSKLWLQRLSDRKTVYHWDRGLDLPPDNRAAAALADFLAAGLAEAAFGH